MQRYIDCLIRIFLNLYFKLACDIFYHISHYEMIPLTRNHFIRQKRIRKKVYNITAVILKFVMEDR